MQEVLGQERALRTLLRAVASGRMHHAWVFHGPAGVGKFTTAAALAKVLLCPRAVGAGEEPRACGGCASCKLAAAGSHPDLHVIQKELAAVSSVGGLRESKQRNIPLDLLRERMLGGKTADDRFHDAAAGKKAMMGHGKVFIIDEAELLDAYGQNALLKTLEEPPAGTTVILITSRPELLAATIRSRCQLLGFSALSAEQVGQWVARRQRDMGAQERGWLVEFADGSLGRAELGGEFGLWRWVPAVAEALEAMRQRGEAEDMGTTMAQFTEAFAEQWVGRRTNASKEAANHLAAGLMTGTIGQHLRRKLAEEARAAGGRELAEAEERLGPYLQAIEALTEHQRDVAANVNLGLVWDHLGCVLRRQLGAAV